MNALLSAPLAAVNWVDDRLNPIVVKELRQAVKSRVVVGVLVLMLVVLLVILGVSLVDTPGTFDDGAGSTLFIVFQSILLATCMFFVPVYAGVRLAAERQGAASDLLYVTTIRPASVVWGKLLAAMVVTALVFSACAPFMVITYLLRGIDLPTILFVLAVDALVVLAATQVAIFIGTLPIGWPVKTFLALILGGLFMSAFTGVVGTTVGFIQFGIGSSFADPDFWVGFAVSVACWLAGVTMVFLLSVAIIAPPTSNRALPLRAFLTFVWAATFGLFVWLAWRVGDIEVLASWMAFSTVVLVLAVIVSAGERDTLGPRLRRSVPRNKLLRVPAFLFYSGITGGLMWCAILLFLTLWGTWLAFGYFERLWAGASGTTMYNASNPLFDAWLPRFACVLCWVYGYVLFSVLLCRRSLMLKNGPRGKDAGGASGGAATGVMAIILMCLLSVLPMILAFALNPERWERDLMVWMTLNPLGPVLVEDRDWEGTYGTVAFGLSITFAAVMLLVNLPWFWRQVKEFHPPAAEEAQEGEAATGGGDE